MTNIPYAELTTDEWVAWHQKADAAGKELWRRFRRRAIAGDDINGDLYKAMKDIMFERFGNRCSFCETLIRGLDQPGDVEHYRPKLGVQGRDRQAVLVTPAGRKKPVAHRGYFWLAYTWKNLIPACRLCNSPGRNAKGELVGKGNVFPVKGRYATGPDEADQEEPLLLHPYFDDPDDHLMLEGRTGILLPRTERGEVTIEVLDLNRTELVFRRRQAYIHFFDVLVKLVTVQVEAARNGLAPSEPPFEAEELKRFQENRSEYLIALRQARADFDKAFKNSLGALPPPTPARTGRRGS